MTETPETCTKGEFAALCNVSPGRVSQWIKEGKITPDALVGEGRSARINTALASAQVNLRRDVGQAFGNGLSTRLSTSVVLPVPALAAMPSSGLGEPPRPSLPAAGFDPVEERIKREKLDEIARRNRIAAAKEAEEAGRYVETVAARREMARIAGGMLQVLEQALDTFATAVAEQFQVPQRDVLHLLKGEFRKVRERAAEAHARQADALARTVEVAEEATDPTNPITEAEHEEATDAD